MSDEMERRARELWRSCAAYVNAPRYQDDEVVDKFTRLLKQVRLATLEEAAKVAESEPRVWEMNAPDPQHRIAAAIRALAGGQSR